MRPGGSRGRPWQQQNAAGDRDDAGGLCGAEAQDVQRWRRRGLGAPGDPDTLGPWACRARVVPVPRRVRRPHPGRANRKTAQRSSVVIRESFAPSWSLSVDRRVTLAPHHPSEGYTPAIDQPHHESRTETPISNAKYRAQNDSTSATSEPARHVRASALRRPWLAGISRERRRSRGTSRTAATPRGMATVIIPFTRSGHDAGGLPNDSPRLPANFRMMTLDAVSVHFLLLSDRKCTFAVDGDDLDGRRVDGAELLGYGVVVDRVNVSVLA